MTRSKEALEKTIVKQKEKQNIRLSDVTKLKQEVLDLKKQLGSFIITNKELSDRNDKLVDTLMDKQKQIASIS